MIARNHDALSSQKDKSNVACGSSIPEVMSTMGSIEINGCEVSMSIAEKEDPAIDQAVAEMLIESYMRRCRA